MNNKEKQNGVGFVGVVRIRPAFAELSNHESHDPWDPMGSREMERNLFVPFLVLVVAFFYDYYDYYVILRNLKIPGIATGMRPH